MPVYTLLLLYLSFIHPLLFPNERQDARKVKQLVEAIRARGEPTTKEDLTEQFPIRQGVEDVTATWLEGMEPLARDAYKDASEKLPIVGTDSKLALPQSGPVISECEALLKANQYSLQKFYEAVAKGGFARFPIDYSKLFLDLPHVANAHAASNLIRLDLELSARRGDAANAGKSLIALFQIWRAFDGEPTLVSQISIFSRDRSAREALANSLLRLDVPEADLRTIQTEVRQRNRAREMKIALLGERVISFNAMHDLSLLDEKLEKGSHTPPSDVVYYLNQMSQRIAVFDLAFPDALREFERIEADHIRRSVRKNPGRQRAVSDVLLIFHGLSTEMTAQDIAGSRAADGGIAVECYRREHSKLPDSLDALVPKYLPSVPVDPFNGKPMIYKVTEEGFWIYSVGKNKVDDGGRLDNKPGEDKRIRDEGLFFPVK